MAQQVSGFAWLFLAGKILAPWSGPLLPLPSPQAHRLFVDFPSPAKLPRAVTYLCLHLLVSSFPLCPLLSGLTPSASPNTLSLFQLPNSERISQASSSSATHLDFVLEILLPLFSRPLTFPPASRRCPPRWPLLSSEDHRSSLLLAVFCFWNNLRGRLLLADSYDLSRYHADTACPQEGPPASRGREVSPPCGAGGLPLGPECCGLRFPFICFAPHP